MADRCPSLHSLCLVATCLAVPGLSRAEAGAATRKPHAGARSILASLWSVSDESTADLMKRFYTHLKAGKTKDEALRAAQVELIQGATASHPFHWAAFQLVGDWR